MLICNECKAQLKETAKFCTNCGTKVDYTDVEKVAVQDTDQANAVENQDIESVAGDKTAAVTNTPGVVEDYLFDYWDFLKESLMTPSAVFRSGKATWINGLISVGLFSIVITLNIHVGIMAYNQTFLTSLLWVGISQAVFVGVLFLINRFLLGGSDDYLAALGKYGGLINTQIILFLLIKLLGMNSSFTGFLVLVALLNTVNIFNLYVLNSQTNKKGKLDKYYQLILSYIALAFMMYLMIRVLFDIFL